MNINSFRARGLWLAAGVGIAGLVIVGCSSSTGSSNPSSSQDQPAPGDGNLEPVQTGGQHVLAPVAIKSPADFGNGAKLETTKTSRVNVQGQGPGEVSGRGIRFELKFTNGTDHDIDLSPVTTNALYGKDDTPASPTAVSSDQPFSGVVKPGQSVTAYYTFTIPKDATSDVQLQVSYSADQPIVVLKGSV